MLFGAPSLAYPFGSDQGLFWYIGREWLLHGAVPYRDTFDIKPPPIYLLHGLSSLISGGGMWGIRLVEWLAMIPLGFVVGSLATPPDEKPAKRDLALGVFAVNLVYFGFFDFWDSAQTEIWCGLAIAGALYAVERLRTTPNRAAAFAGFLCGLAVLTKPPCAILALVVVAVFVQRRRTEARRRVMAGLGVFVAGAVIPLLVTVVYFAAASALGDMIDVVVRYNSEYVKNDRGNAGADTIAGQLRLDVDSFGPFWIAVHIALVAGVVLRRPARSRWILAASFVVAAMLGIAAQRKFYHYHYGLLVPGYALAIVLGAREVRVARRPLFIAAVVAVFATSIRGARQWSVSAWTTARYVTGVIDRERFASRFEVRWFDWNCVSRERAGAWLREHTTPDEPVLVRGFDPVVYAYAQRRYGGRFATTHHLTSPKVVYRREEWLAQDAADIARIAPRIVVAREPPGFGPDINDERWFLERGYHSVERIPPFVMMERD